MENESSKDTTPSEDEYQAAEHEQDHEIFQAEKEPQQRQPSNIKPIFVVLGLVLLIIGLYKLYVYFATPAPKQVTGVTTTSDSNLPGGPITSATPLPKATTNAMAPSSGIPSITPTSTVSPAANVPKTQPAAAVLPASTNSVSSSVNQSQAAASPVTPSVAQPQATVVSVTSTAAQSQTTPPSVTPPVVQPQITPPSATVTAGSISTPTVKASNEPVSPAMTGGNTSSFKSPTLNAANTSSNANTASATPFTSPTINAGKSSTAAATTTEGNASSSFTSPTISAGTIQLSKNDANQSATGSATAMDNTQNTRLDTLEQGMNQNRTAIQNLQNQINSLASSISNLQSGINTLNNTLSNIKNVQQVNYKPQIPVRSTIIKTRRVKRFQNVASLQESAYLAPRHTVVSPQSQDAGYMSGGAQFYVKAMIQGRAWLVSPDGMKTVTISSGDYLPGYGLIEDIDPGKGIVTTSAGGIIQYNPQDR